MATNPLKDGLCNLPMNITEEEREVWRSLRLANDRFSSMGDALKQMSLAGLEVHFPEAAAEIRRIRDDYARSTQRPGGSISRASLPLPPADPPAKKKPHGNSTIHGAKLTAAKSSRNRPALTPKEKG
jgi:hypothetical protein